MDESFSLLHSLFLVSFLFQDAEKSHEKKIKQKKTLIKKDTNKKSKKDTQKRWLPPQIDMGRLKQMHLLLLACF